MLSAYEYHYGTATCQSTTAALARNTTQESTLALVSLNTDLSIAFLNTSVMHPSKQKYIT
jgi:hypothetical protein